MRRSTIFVVVASEKEGCDDTMAVDCCFKVRLREIALWRFCPRGREGWDERLSSSFSVHINFSRTIGVSIVLLLCRIPNTRVTMLDSEPFVYHIGCTNDGSITSPAPKPSNQQQQRGNLRRGITQVPVVEATSTHRRTGSFGLTSVNALGGAKRSKRASV